MTDAERDQLHLSHILECIDNIESDVGGDRQRLVGNRTIRDAVMRNLQVLAEPTQRLSDDIKAAHPEIPWPNIAGFRHRLVHDYFRIDLDLVWRVIEQHLPELKAAVTAMQRRP